MTETSENTAAAPTESRDTAAGVAEEAVAQSAAETEKEPFDPAPLRLTPESAVQKRRTAETAYVFDLRPVEDFQEGHLAGSHSLPFEFLESNLHRLPFTGDLIFYDGGEGLALQGAALLHDNGFTDHFYVEEGLDAILAALEAAPDEIKFAKLSADEQRKAIESVLDEKVRAFLERDGGGLEIIDIEGERVKVRYFGACGSCGSSTAGTLRFIEGALTVALNHDMEVVPVD